MTLRAAFANLDEADPPARELRGLVEEALEQAQQANSELRELAQGILPPALTRGGLRAGVTALLSRMTLPVTVDLEAPYTYEGTAEIHTLIVGHALTSIRAFA
jgi:signal transduction histidine kinase